MATVADNVLLVAAPEAYEVKAAGKHAPAILMSLTIGFAVLLILIGIVVISTAKSKTSGYLLSLFGFILGGGAVYFLNKKSAAKTE